MPGFGGDMVRPYKRPALTELHRARAAAVRKAAAETAPLPAAEAKEPAAAATAAQAPAPAAAAAQVLAPGGLGNLREAKCLFACLVPAMLGAAC